MEKQNACCFTGHRKIPAQEMQAVTACLRRELEKLAAQGVTEFYAGGAQGFDTIAALAVLDMKKRGEKVRLHLVLPYPGQAKGWPQDDVEAYERIKAEADEVETIGEHYFRGCMQIRNRRLVDESRYCLCYLTQDKGGTHYTVKYAQKSGLTVINCAPEA